MKRTAGRKMSLYIAPWVAMLLALCCLGCTTKAHLIGQGAKPLVQYPEYPPLESPNMEMEIQSISRTGIYGRTIKADVVFINQGEKDIVVDTHGLRLSLYLYELEPERKTGPYDSERLVPFDSYYWLIEDRYFILPAGEKRMKSFTTRYMGFNPIESFAYGWPDCANEEWESIEWEKCEASFSYWHPFRKLTEAFDTNARVFDYTVISTGWVRLTPPMEPNKPPMQIDLVSARFSEDDSGQIQYEVRVESDSDVPITLDAHGFRINIEWFDRKSLLELNAYGVNSIRLADDGSIVEDDARMIAIPPKSTIFMTFRTSYIGCLPGTTYYKDNNRLGDPLKRNWNRRMADRYRVQLFYSPPEEKPSPELNERGKTNESRSVFSEKIETDLGQKCFVGDRWLHHDDESQKP